MSNKKLNHQIASDKLDRQNTRLLFIDGLRGIAAVAVAGFHFYMGGPLREVLSIILPVPLTALLARGNLGIEIFFVISGFAIAYSLSNACINFRFAANFALRRALRLSPPYWATIALAIALNWISNLLLSDRAAPIPSMKTIVAHIFYLQNIFKLGDIVPVFWTLCLEIQFYIVFVILLGISQYLIKKLFFQDDLALLLGFVPLALISIFSKLLNSYSTALFISYWYMFFAGVMACWVLAGKVRHAWFWYYIGAISTTLLIQPDMKLIIALVTVCLIYLAGICGQMHSWLSALWLQYLGKISYSLYLLHIVLGTRAINIGYRLTKDSLLASIGLFIAAFAVSIAGSHFMYLLIEKPMLSASKQLKLKTLN